MTTERRSTYFGRIRQDAAQFAHDAYVVLRQWCRLAWYLGCCLVVTIRLVLRIILWMVRVLSPIPIPVGTDSRYRKRATGLAIPTFDVMVVVFGAFALVGYLW